RVPGGKRLKKLKRRDRRRNRRARRKNSGFTKYENARSVERRASSPVHNLHEHQRLVLMHQHPMLQMSFHCAREHDLRSVIGSTITLGERFTSRPMLVSGTVPCVRFWTQFARRESLFWLINAKSRPYLSRNWSDMTRSLPKKTFPLGMIATAMASSRSAARICTGWFTLSRSIPTAQCENHHRYNASSVTV